MSDCALAIAAGGQGIRLGRRDKGLLSLPDGTPLVQYLLRQLEPYSWREILLLCRPDQATHYQTLIGQAQLVFDQYGPGFGPMAALHTALQSATCDWVQLWPVDAPIVCPQLLQTLDQATAPALIPQDASGRLQPLFGRYHISLLPSLTRHLTEQRLAISRWLQDIQAPTLPWSEHACFTNLNEPQDLAFLQHIC